LKILRNIDWDSELNQKTPHELRLSKWYVCNISGTVKDIKFKNSENIKRDFELNKKTLYTSRFSKRRIRNISGNANDVKLKLSGYVEGGKNFLNRILFQRRVKSHINT
jgi:hypothetical protein